MIVELGEKQGLIREASHVRTLFLDVSVFGKFYTRCLFKCSELFRFLYKHV
jgi:hypothetical protein